MENVGDNYNEVPVHKDRMQLGLKTKQRYWVVG